MDKILFVCLGNICRSPMAETVMKKTVETEKENFEIDSCGLISYHQGEMPDSRMISAAMKSGYRLSHRARKITDIGMDKSNVEKLRQLAGKNRQKIRLISEFFDGSIEYDCVPDPYYGSTEDFFTVIKLLENACGNLYKYLKNNEL